MNSAALDIRDRLLALGIIDQGFVSEEPSTPNDVVTVYDTGGSDPIPDIELYTTSVQVRVRAKTYSDAYSRQDEIRRALIVTPTFEINGTHYIGVWNVGDIISIGKDQNNRSVLTTNYRIERQPL